MNQYCVSTFSFPKFELEDFLGDLAAIGISTIELGKMHYEALDPETAARLQAENGLRFKSMLTTEDIAAPDGLDVQVGVLDIAHKLSIPMVSVSSGGREESSEAEIEMIIDRLKMLTQEAERRNIMLSFYPHGGWMAYNLERTERIFDAIQSDSFGFYYCPYHFQVAGDDPVVALERLVHRMVNVYFDCGIDPETGETPLWAPATDYPAVCQAIKRAGYKEEIMIIYLGLDSATPGPIVDGIVRARALIDEMMV